MRVGGAILCGAFCHPGVLNVKPGFLREVGFHHEDHEDDTDFTEPTDDRMNLIRKAGTSARIPMFVRFVLFVVVSGSSKLLKLAAAGFQQCEETIRAAHVTRADHHEIRFAAAKIAVDFREPVLVTHVDQARGQ